ncbi:MAG TPA: cobyric acid synthase [Acidimicrobiales bacterium]|nr:cobyric acid synthase [Acidimicrobiales bacterium]
MTKGSLLVLGTSSGAGKTTLVTGLCRWLARRGVSVAPFKAQNMSLNSYVTRQGEEMARAQATQARAAGVEPEAVMNPVLLKPGSETRSQLIVMGHPVGELEAGTGWGAKGGLLDLVVDAYRDLERRFDVVVCEGAGSPAEINLRRSDIVNLGFARAAGVPAIVIGDIDPGGVFAAFAGTVALLSAQDQDFIHGWVVNRFRGDRSLLQPGLDMMAALTGRPTFGVLPYVLGIGIDAEDALDREAYASPDPPLGEDVLHVDVVRLPHASNLTDLDALSAEPGLVVRFITRPEEMMGADLVVLPGTRATASDLSWLRGRGFPAALEARAAAERPILGICGGFQMLGLTIEDQVESGVGLVKGLGLLPVNTVFGHEKVLTRSECTLADGITVAGYEIHYGRVTVGDGAAFFADQGCSRGSVAGTTWHGLFENDAFRRSYLLDVAAQSGRDFIPSTGLAFDELRQLRIDTLADLMDNYLDMAELLRVLEGRAVPPARVSLSLTWP